MTVSASEAGDAMGAVAAALQRSDIVEPEGYNVLLRLARELRSKRSAVTWSVEVDRGAPIQFRRTKDEKSKYIKPRIVAEGIKIVQRPDTDLPFEALDIALEIDDDENSILSRWHLDLANSSQSAPLTHLQYGGHIHENRELDHPVKVPRWCHPPMEIALFCEVVAANFFPKEWFDLRSEPNWCQAISIFQKLCYTHYFDRMTRCLSISTNTALGQMWINT